MDRNKCCENALKDVEQGLTIRKATAKWVVHRSTVQDKLNGQTEQMISRPRPLISKAEEERLATWLIERAKRGFSLSVDEFLDSVTTFLDKYK